MEPRDCEGSLLQVGDLVVFNQSSKLCRGNIVRITERKLTETQKRNWGKNLYYNIFIDAGTIAKVQNTLGIYRLRDYD